MKVKGEHIPTEKLCNILRGLHAKSNHYFRREELEDALIEYGIERWKLASHRILDRLRTGGVVDSNEATGWEFTTVDIDGICDVFTSPLTELVNYKKPKNRYTPPKAVKFKNGKLQLKPHETAHGRLNK